VEVANYRNIIMLYIRHHLVQLTKFIIVMSKKLIYVTKLCLHHQVAPMPPRCAHATTLCLCHHVVPTPPGCTYATRLCPCHHVVPMPPGCAYATGWCICLWVVPVAPGCAYAIGLSMSGGCTYKCLATFIVISCDLGYQT
jgi:hypothetical protein